MNGHTFSKVATAGLALVLLFPSVLAAQPRQWAESFDAGELEECKATCHLELVPEEDGRFLSVFGHGHVIWLASGPLEEFTLSFRCRWREPESVAEVALRVAEPATRSAMYALRLQSKEVALLRRVGDSERPLTTVPCKMEGAEWRHIQVAVQVDKITVLVNGDPILTARDPQPLEPGLVGLGIATGNVDYDDFVLRVEQPGAAPPDEQPEQPTEPPPGQPQPEPRPGEPRPEPEPAAPPPPPPTAPQPKPVPPPQPQPKPGPQPRPAETDLTVADIYAKKLRKGDVWVEIVNRGPRALHGNVAELITVVNGKKTTRALMVDLPVGQPKPFFTGAVIDASQGDQDITTTVRVPGVRDLNPANNTRHERIPRLKVPAPSPAPPPGPTPKVDIGVTDIFPVKVPTGTFVHMRITNFGSLPFDQTLTVQVKAKHGMMVRYVHVKLAPKQTIAVSTEAALGGLPDHVTVRIEPMGIKDENPANDKRTETFK